MSINGTGSTNNTDNTNKTNGTNGSNAKSSTSDIGLDKNAFLQMLVAQLKYQNPLNPTDGSQYMAQMAQFATVEQLEHISQAQSAMGPWQQALAGQGMVGKQVVGTDSKGLAVTGLVTGMKLLSSGPMLVLNNGSTLSVASVDAVSEPKTTTTTKSTSS